MEEAVVVEVHTRVNYDLFCDYQRFVSSGGKKYYKKYPFRRMVIEGIAYVGTILVLRLVLRFAMGIQEMHHSVRPILIFIAFWGTRTVIDLYNYYVSPKRLYKKQREYLERKVVFQFTQDEVIVQDDADKPQNKRYWEYDTIPKVHELNNVFYLDVKENESYILDKKQMAQDDAEAVSKLLQEKFGKRYMRIEAD